MQALRRVIVSCNRCKTGRRTWMSKHLRLFRSITDVNVQYGNISWPLPSGLKLKMLNVGGLVWHPGSGVILPSRQKERLKFGSQRWSFSSAHCPSASISLLTCSYRIYKAQEHLGEQKNGEKVSALKRKKRHKVTSLSLSFSCAPCLSAKVCKLEMGTVCCVVVVEKRAAGVTESRAEDTDKGQD